VLFCVPNAKRPEDVTPSDRKRTDFSVKYAKNGSLCYFRLTAAAAKNYYRDQNDNPAIVVAEERIKAAHCDASLHYFKIMMHRRQV
jgi:hypothetical protein